MNNPSAATISVHYSWTTSVLLGDINLFEPERLDKPRVTVEHELTIVGSSVDDTSHSAISSHQLQLQTINMYIKRYFNNEMIKN